MQQLYYEFCSVVIVAVSREKTRRREAWESDTSKQQQKAAGPPRQINAQHTCHISSILYVCCNRQETTGGERRNQSTSHHRARQTRRGDAMTDGRTDGQRDRRTVIFFHDITSLFFLSSFTFSGMLYCQSASRTGSSSCLRRFAHESITYTYSQKCLWSLLDVRIV